MLQQGTAKSRGSARFQKDAECLLSSSFLCSFSLFVFSFRLTRSRARRETFRRGSEKSSPPHRRVASSVTVARVQLELRRKSPMNALPFAMIRRNHNDSHDSQDAIQAAQSGQRSWPVATTVPSTKRVRSSRFPLARTERLETPPVSDQDGLSDFSNLSTAGTGGVGDETGSTGCLRCRRMK